MDFMSGIPSTNHVNNFVFLVIDLFLKMEILEPYKNSVTIEATLKLLFEHLSLSNTIFCLGMRCSKYIMNQPLVHEGHPDA